MLRIKISFSSLLILNGCNNEINQVEIDEDNTNISIENIETGSDFTLDDIKEFILFADTLADKITDQYTLSILERDRKIGDIERKNSLKNNYTQKIHTILGGIS